MSVVIICFPLNNSLSGLYELMQHFMKILCFNLLALQLFYKLGNYIKNTDKQFLTS